MQLLIIDALNLIRRIYAVQTTQHQDEASQLAATRATVEQVARKLLGQFTPSHVVAVFDGAPEGFRHRLFPDYKAGRPPMPGPLAAHMDELQQSLWQLGIDALLSDTDEADDLIATLANTLAAHRRQVTIISTDKGFCQLLNPWVRLWDHFNQRWLDSAHVQQQYGLAVGQLVDYWALTGVSGSGIKGVPGIGPKRAKSLLQQHGSLDQLLMAPAETRDEKTVHQHGSQALLARQLVRLVDDIELGFNLKDLRYRR
ncbi:flap endonuclease Xni [Zobellella maritima]|uniref:flap endonuclease Xni n=1 Tax=Zobellella maritima TaxID=2059725 RepID=UPI000E300CAA|nr:flap endonuclease Xni [Zobellella maritima]